MAGASFRMDLSGLRGMVGKAIAHVQARQEIMEQIGEQLVSSTQQRFEDGRGPGGENWEPSIRAQAEGGQTLVDTARLKNSIGYEASLNLVAVGTNVEYAATHQFGADIRAKNAPYLRFQVGGRWARKKAVSIPPRPFIGISKQDIVDTQQTVQTWLAAGFGVRAGR